MSSSVTSRSQELAKFPEEFGKAVTSLAYTTSSTIMSIFSICTLGLNSEINMLAQSTDHTHKMLKPLYCNLLNIVNPSALKIVNPSALKIVNPSAQVGTSTDRGMMTLWFAKPRFDAAHKASNQSGFFKKHVVSRTLFGLAGLVAVITNVVDMVLALSSATLSFITLGTVSDLNEAALMNLAFPRIVTDCTTSLRGMINPHQEFFV